MRKKNTSFPGILFYPEKSFYKEVAMSVVIRFVAPNNILMKGALRGGGDTRILMMTENIFLWIISVPFGLLSGFVWKLPPFWVFFCLRMDNPFKAVWCVRRLKSKKWIKQLHAA